MYETKELAVAAARSIYHNELRRDIKNIQGALQKGMYAKANLIDGYVYDGYCRNATQAVWNRYTGKFIYMRTKFGSTFPEFINHPEDDTDFDIFVPTRISDL